MVAQTRQPQNDGFISFFFSDDFHNPPAAVINEGQTILWAKLDYTNTFFSDYILYFLFLSTKFMKSPKHTTNLYKFITYHKFSHI